MAFTYTASQAASRALDWIRMRVGATKSDGPVQIDDDEIAALLAGHSLTISSDPVANRRSVHRAAADVCRQIAANLGRQSGIALTQVGPIKNTSAEFFLKLAKELEATVALTQANDLEPHEEVDSVAYEINARGDDLSEYVGDTV